MQNIINSRNIINNISHDAHKLLIYIYENGSAEYKDPQYQSISDFIGNSLYLNLVEEFKIRNCDGTLYLIPELIKYSLVDKYFSEYTDKYILSDFGKKILVSVIRKEKLKKLEKL